MTRITFDTRSVAAVAVATFISIFLTLSVLPASASTSTFFPKVWASDPEYFLAYRHSGFTGNSFSNAVHAADNPWEAVAGNSLDFDNGGTNTSVFAWQNACLSPTGGVYVGTAAISPLALEKTCANSTTISRSNIAVDRTDRVWEFGPANASNSEWDLRGVLVHEFGHAAGFAGHFGGPSNCPGGNADQSMCNGLSLGEDHVKTLGSADKSEVAAAY